MSYNRDIGSYIKVINDHLEKNCNNDLKRFDLTISQIRVLMFLNERNGRKTSQKDIEEYLEVTHPTVIGIIKRLESKGFIRSETDAKDRRIKNIYLTEKESQVRDHMERSRSEIEARLTSNMSAEQVDQLKSLLELVYQNL